MFRVTIIGGGMSGCRLAMELHKTGLYDISIISNTGVFEFIPSFPFLFSNPKHIDKIQKSHQDVFVKHVNIIKGSVKELDYNMITLDDETKWDNFDICIIATGSHYNIDSIKRSSDEKVIFPIINCLSSSDIVQNAQNVEIAKRLVIVGAGPAGIEFCAEIMYKYPFKEVYLINSRNKFLETMNSSAHGVIKTHFDKFKNLTTIHGNRVVKISGSKVFLKDSELDCDCLLVCTGLKPNTAFVSKSLQNDLLEQKGHVQVNDYLQSPKFGHIFAVGDVTSVQEQKMYALGIRHSQYLGKHLLSIILNRNPLLYSSVNKGVVLSLGPEKAMLLKWNKVFFESKLLSSIQRSGDQFKVAHVKL